MALGILSLDWRILGRVVLVFWMSIQPLDCHLGRSMTGYCVVFERFTALSVGSTSLSRFYPCRMESLRGNIRKFILVTVLTGGARRRDNRRYGCGVIFPGRVPKISLLPLRYSYCFHSRPQHILSFRPRFMPARSWPTLPNYCFSAAQP